MASKSRVILVGPAKEAFANLNQTILRSAKSKIENLKQDPMHGIHIAKKKIPKYYLKEFEVNNLWKVNLANAWRLVYTIRGGKDEIEVIVLDIFGHNNYNKRFGYRKR